MMGRKPLGRKTSLALRPQGLGALLADVRELIVSAPRTQLAQECERGFGEKRPVLDDPDYRGLSGSRHCRITATTFGRDILPAAYPH